MLKSPLTKEGNQLLKFLDGLSSSQQKEPFTLLGHQVSTLEVKSSGSAVNGTIDNTSSPLRDQSSLADHLKGLMKSMGFSYEHEVVQFLKHPEGKELLRNEELKPLLIDFLTRCWSAWSGRVGRKALRKRPSGTRSFASASASSRPIAVAPRIGSTRAWNWAARMSRPGQTVLTAAPICCGKAR